jgi:hypothetical protein
LGAVLIFGNRQHFRPKLNPQMTAFVDKESERPEVKATSDWTSDLIEIKLADMMLQLSQGFTSKDESSTLQEVVDICEETRLPPPLPYFARRFVHG